MHSHDQRTPFASADGRTHIGFVSVVQLEVFDPSYFVDFSLVEKDPVSLEKAPAGCQIGLAKPKEMTKEMAQKLAEIPPDGKIPDNSYGAAFSNKISVKCP